MKTSTESPVLLALNRKLVSLPANLLLDIEEVGQVSAVP